tara:strand:- start:239 stop:466 length:228 start_codon:yes stop_codon:yes gene_type:complete
MLMDWVEEMCPAKGIEVVVVKVNLMVLLALMDLIEADKLQAAAVVVDNKVKHGVLIPIHLTPVIQDQDLVMVDRD